LPNGVTYNSYLVKDDKTVLLDTVDKAIEKPFLENLEYALDGRKLDYLIITHMECDHAASLAEVLLRHPELTLVGNAKTFALIEQFFDFKGHYNKLEVKDKETLDIGHHKFTFLFAPMVHWPEVMAVYEESNKMVFSADAFGTFGAFSGNIFSDEMNFFEEWLPEARRYYTNIVGKYGVQTVNLLKKLSDFEVNYICPLHGPIWRDKDLIAQFIEKYKIWASYAPEDNAVVIFYGTIYGATEDVATLLAGEIAKLGVKNIKMYDVSATDTSYLVSEAFRAKTLVFAAASYNAGLFPYMNILLDDLKEHSIQNRNVVLIENGSWALSAGKRMSDFISGMKNMTLLADTLSIKSSLKDEQLPVIYELARKIKDSL
jgi:flavodoxin